MKYRLVCFDLDGTLVDETDSVWISIHSYLGVDGARRKKAMDRYYAKEITYKEWANHDMVLWAEKDANKEKLMKAISHFKLMEGAKETLIELKKRGYKIALLSGSVSFVLDNLIPEYKEIFDHIFINHIHFDEGGKISKTEWTCYDDEGKADALRLICKKEGIPVEQSVFLGDHWNDVHVMKAAGLKIAFNSKHEKLREVADVVIDKKDVREILRHL